MKSMSKFMNDGEEVKAKSRRMPDIVDKDFIKAQGVKRLKHEGMLLQRDEFSIDGWIKLEHECFLNWHSGIGAVISDPNSKDIITSLGDNLSEEINRDIDYE